MSNRGTRLAMAVCIVMAVAAGATADDSFEWSYQPRAGHPSNADPPVPADLDLQLMLDDDSAEGAFGIGAPTARQFLWFNRFTPGPEQISLEEIWVLFPSGPNMAVGSAVEIVVFYDSDGDPANGATLVASYDETIQVADDNTFSVYTVDPPLFFQNTGDILIGVVNRFVVSGVTPTTTPAAIDTSPSQGRSWLALWTGDPPSPPLLPADILTSQIDSFQAGNWMIRGFGRRQVADANQVPMLSGVGLALVIILLAGAGVLLVMRRQ